MIVLIQIITAVIAINMTIIIITIITTCAIYLHSALYYVRTSCLYAFTAVTELFEIVRHPRSQRYYITIIQYNIYVIMIYTQITSRIGQLFKALIGGWPRLSLSGGSENLINYRYD